MKYLVFAGHQYYPAGGWDDLIAKTETLGDAYAALAGKAFDWWQIVEVSTLKVVSSQ
jgi:hypothetical protein